MFGKNKEKEIPLEELPIAPYPEYVNQKSRASERAQPMMQQMMSTRPRATGDLFSMEKVTQGKNEFIEFKIMALQKDAGNFRIGKILLVQ